jgi:galactose mutarotase-like enzyme
LIQDDVMSQPERRALVSIASPNLSAEIDPLGAQLSALRDPAGLDLLWDGDPAVWTGRAPILFPIVGELADGRYRLDGKTYALGRHGFARHKMFEVADGTPSSVTFILRADDTTLAVYPFRFQLDVTFTLAGPGLTLTASVRNLDDRPLPASFGFHPALRWPLPYGQARDLHRVVFDQDEPAPVRRIDSRGLLTSVSHPTPVVGRELALRDALFEDDALIFDSLASRELWYGAREGPQLRIGFPDTPYLGVWTKPGGGFICLEPWHGIADPVGFDGDFRAKPGVFEVAPGGARRMTMSIALDG